MRFASRSLSGGKLVISASYLPATVSLPSGIDQKHDRLPAEAPTRSQRVALQGPCKERWLQAAIEPSLMLAMGAVHNALKGDRAISYICVYARCEVARRVTS